MAQAITSDPAAEVASCAATAEATASVAVKTPVAPRHVAMARMVTKSRVAGSWSGRPAGRPLPIQPRASSYDRGLMQRKGN